MRRVYPLIQNHLLCWRMCAMKEVHGVMYMGVTRGDKVVENYVKHGLYVGMIEIYIYLN